MKIYDAHSTSFDFEKEIYTPLRAMSSFEFIFAHEHGKDILFSSKELFQKKQCDLVLAEVSMPSTGLGIELGWANDAGIPIVCVHKDGYKTSQSLKTVTTDVIAYNGPDDLVAKLTEILNYKS